MSEKTVPIHALFREKESLIPIRLDLLREEPLSIRVQGRPYVVVMRTPGEETAHIAGFGLAEGILDNPGDIETIASCEGESTNVVTLTVTPQRLAAISDVLERKGFISQTSCGICGKELVGHLSQKVHALADGPLIDLEGAFRCLEELEEHQVLYQRCCASHAAAIYTPTFDLLSMAEDVGRHNALDKAIGKLFLEGALDRAGVLVLSSRISYEMVQKAARARIPFIIAASRPTSLAVELADSVNITLASQNRDSGIYVYCGLRRIVGAIP